MLFVYFVIHNSFLHLFIPHGGILLIWVKVSGPNYRIFPDGSGQQHCENLAAVNFKSCLNEKMEILPLKRKERCTFLIAKNCTLLFPVYTFGQLCNLTLVIF